MAWSYDDTSDPFADAVDVSQYAEPATLPDTAYTGLFDTATGFSGGTDTGTGSEGVPFLAGIGVVGPSPASPTPGSPVNLGGFDDRYFTVSTPDLMSPTDPSAHSALTGVSDPPFASASKSTPTPDAFDLSSELTNALGALSKFGSSIAVAMGGTPRTVSYSQTPVSSITTGNASGRLVTSPNLASSTISGSGTLILVIAAVAIMLLLMKN